MQHSNYQDTYILAHTSVSPICVERELYKVMVVVVVQEEDSVAGERY